MQSIFLYCDKTEGSIEIALSKREMAIENSMICADYKRIGTDVYEIELFYGFKDLDIVQSLEKATWNVSYDDIKNCLIEHVVKQLEQKHFRTMLRKKLREMRKEVFITSDLEWKIIKFYPTEEQVGYEGIEVTAEYNSEKVEFYVISINRNKLFMKAVEFEENTVDKNSFINEKMKELVKEELPKFIKERQDKNEDRNN